MKKSEFSEQRKFLQGNITAANKALNEFTKNYIESHKEFSINDKIRVTYESGKMSEGFVCYVGTHDDGEIFYSLNGIKKDGTQSKHRVYNYGAEKITNREIIP
jgi:hypothetical protein